MRVGLISDLHGNEVALRAARDCFERDGVDQVVCLGDVATLGPQPGAVLQLLREFGWPCILGNHDEFLLDEQLIHQYTEVPAVVDAVNWCRSQLSSAELAFVRTFQRQLELPLGGDARLLLYHGSPRSHMEDILATTPVATLEAYLDGQRATVLAGGHTHIQMLRQHRGMLLVNPGSLGMPFEEYVTGRAPTVLAHAEYAIVEAERGNVSVSLHRVQLDRRVLREAVAAVDHPLRSWLLQEYRD